jgi:hypothetical protein
MSALGRGLSVAGYAAGDMFARGALMDQQSELETQKALRLAEFQEKYKIAAEDRGIKNRTTERGLMFAESVERAPQLRDIKAADRKAEKMVDYDPEVTDAQLTAEEKKARSKAQIEREEMIASGSDPAYLKAKRNLAQATHIEGLGSVATAELAKYGLAEKQKVASLIDEFESADTKPERKAQIKESLTVRGIIKPGEFDTEKVTEESYDANGNLIKRERTQKRRADGSTAPAVKQDVRVAGQVIGQASTPEEAQELVAKWKAGKGAPEKKTPVVGGTSGSHTPRPNDDSQERQLRAQIMDKRNRLALQGIGPEAKVQLMLELRELEDRLNGKSALR